MSTNLTQLNKKGMALLSLFLLNFAFISPAFAAIPTISEVTAVVTPTSDNTPNYTFTTDVAGTITYAGGCSSTTSPTAIVGSNTVTFDTLADGLYAGCTITVTDLPDVSNVLLVSPFLVDTTAPSTPVIVSPINNSSVTTVALDKVDWTDSTDASPVTYLYSVSFSNVTNPDGSFVTPLATLSTGATSEQPTPGTGAGVYYFIVQASDSLGHLSPWTPVTKVTVDNTAPIISEFTPVPTPATDPTPDYTFTTDEAGTISYGGSCSSATSVASVGNNTVTFNTLADGTYSNCTITVTDSAGNVSNTVTATPFFIDTIVSAPTIVSPTDNSFLTTAAFDKVDWTDVIDISSPITYIYSASFSSATNFDGSFVTPVYTSGALVLSEIPTLGTGAGVYYVSVKAVDVLNNSSPWTTPIKITIDNTAPIISETTPVPTPTTNPTPSYTFTTDEAGTISYAGGCSSVTTSATVGLNTITFITLADGTYSTCTITVTDAATNASNVLAVTSFTIDTTAPVLSLPANITAEATASGGNAITFSATSTDTDPLSPIVTCIPASGATFPITTTTVNCSAIDTIGNISNGSFTVTVQDTTPPVITLLGSDPVALTVGGAAYVEQGATASDIVDGSLTVTNINSSAINQSLPGSYLVTYNVTDAHGNAAIQVTRTVNVSDVDGPVISGVPADIVVEQVGNASATVTYVNPTAVDNVSNPVSVLCSPASGSLFSYGLTAVLCSASDTAVPPGPNTSTASFNVTIQDTVVPTATPVTIASNNTTSTLAKTGDTITVSFTTSESVALPTATIAGQVATVTNVGGNSYTSTYTVTGAEAQGSAAFTLNFSDIVGNAGVQVTATTDASTVMIDTIAPTLAEVTPVPTPANDPTPDYTFSSNETGTISYPTTCVSVTTAGASGNNPITLVALPDGTYSTCTIAVMDSAGNSSSLPISSFTIDTASPQVTIEQASSQIDPTHVPQIEFTAQFNEPIQPLTLTCSDLTLNNASCTGITQHSTSLYTIMVQALAGGIVSVSLPASSVLDTVGNPNLVSTSIDNSVLYILDGIVLPFFTNGGGVLLPSTPGFSTPSPSSTAGSSSPGINQGGSENHNQAYDHLVGLNYPQPAPTHSEPSSPAPSDDSSNTNDTSNTGNTGADNTRYNPTNASNTGGGAGTPTSTGNPNSSSPSTGSASSTTGSDTDTSTGSEEATPVPAVEEIPAVEEGAQLASTSDVTEDVGGGEPAPEQGGNALTWTLLGLIALLNLWWFYAANIKKTPL